MGAGEQLGDTVELRLPIRPEEEVGEGRVRYDLRLSSPDSEEETADSPFMLWLREAFEERVEISLGAEPATPRAVLLHGDACPQLGADYILVQPDVVKRDPSRGWLPIGGRHPKAVQLGREDSPELDLGPDVSHDHGRITATADGIFISDGSRNGTRVIAARSDVVRF